MANPKPEQKKSADRFPLWELAFVIVVIGILSFVLLQAPAGPVQTKNKMTRFNSYSELVAAFQSARSGGRSYGMMEIAVGIAQAPFMVSSIAGRSTSMLGANMAKSAEDMGGTSDYSKTNVQVEGVDEADIVKSDGKYIYNFSQNRLIITDAYPIEGAKIISKTDLNGLSPQEMFVLGDKLVVFGANNGSGYYNEGPMAKTAVGIRQMPPYYYGGSVTVVRVYDISNREAPSQEKELEFNGSYLASRLIGSNAYFVVNSYPHMLYTPDGQPDYSKNIIPLMAEDGVEKRIATAEEIGYLPPMPVQSFVTIASLNLDSLEMQKETIAGNAESVFASLENIYVTSTAWTTSEVPVVKDAERVIIGNTEKTVTNKFSLKDGKISFAGQGLVPGHVLNQFSMDEFEGKFRIATTVGQVSQMGSQSTNNLYVLDEEMKPLGKLEGLAPGEKIYSARFMGKRAYMVTFKKVDPLFVIDLSNPSEPKVLGKLKIPGYSDYLHPIDEAHIIGVGKEAIESTYGDFAWYQGMKLAVFDVSDVENPKEMHKVAIGDRGTDSYALHDHRAFLYDRQKELLVLPIMLSEIPEAQKNLPEEQTRGMPAYGESVFQGAFVYKLTLENGFEERGRITHVTKEDELKRGYYYGDSYSVKRALYIGSVLYTLSDSMLKANDLSTLQELKEFKFA